MTKLQLWTIQWWIIQSVLIWKANGIETLGENIVQSNEFSQGKICSKVRQLGSLTLKNGLEFQEISWEQTLSP